MKILDLVSETAAAEPQVLTSIIAAAHMRSAVASTMTMQADPGAVPDQKTLALVNTYIVGNVRTLNEFSSACEQTLSTVQTSLQAAEARLALLEAQLASAVPAAAADAFVNTDSRRSGADSQGGVSPDASTEAAAVDDGIASVPQKSSHWAAAAEEGLRAGAAGSNADSAEGGAEMHGLKP